MWAALGGVKSEAIYDKNLRKAVDSTILKGSASSKIASAKSCWALF
jgi:hypothetical protein